MQDNFGLIGALIIEPQGSTWQTDDNSRAAATVTNADNTSFREAVVIVQDDLAAVQQPALNYRTEPLTYRFVNTSYLVNDSSSLRTRRITFAIGHFGFGRSADAGIRCRSRKAAAHAGVAPSRPQ